MNLIQRIDALLPQTQCGRCGHPGCMPYAEGIAKGEAINKCPPGGEETLAALARLLNVQAPALETERGPAPAQVAFIREAECIGCTKCIQACPVDAIVGAAKLMHTVLVDECTGCDLCVAPCPVDCIDMLPLPATSAVLPPAHVHLTGDLTLDAAQRQARTRKRNLARQRYQRRNARLRREREQRQGRTPRSAAATPVRPAQHLCEPRSPRAEPPHPAPENQALKHARIAVNMCQAQLNKSLKAFGHPPIREQAMRLLQLQQQLDAAEQVLQGLMPTEQALPDTPAPSQPRPSIAALKRAKIQLAMARASLNKAHAAGAPAEQLAALQAKVQDAEQALRAAE
ncbi:electron transport complex subunit RsxB [Pseudomonas syringae]|nr:electron transport complex subunit RsxB [Pseudomonas syringae]